MFKASTASFSKTVMWVEVVAIIAGDAEAEVKVELEVVGGWGAEVAPIIIVKSLLILQASQCHRRS